MAVAVAPGLAVERLAQRIHRTPAATLKILREFEARGVTVESADGWRLSPTAELLYGNAMRQIPLGEGVEARPVARCLPRRSQ